MNIVVPTITAPNAHVYRQQLERIEQFAKRIHIDFADDTFTPINLMNIAQAYWHDGYKVDLHVMVDDPSLHTETFVALMPHLVVVHVESKGDLVTLGKTLQQHGIEFGVALLQKSKPEDFKELIRLANHVLIFSGSLGKHGGVSDLKLLEKVSQVKEINNKVEIGWDGGINDENASNLVAGGVNVLNTGGFIQKSDDPHAAYATIESVIS